jgi:outer membrane lipoprotein-sorting protein
LASRKWTGLGLVGVLLLTGCVTSGRRGVELVYTYDREALLRELQRRCESITTVKAKLKMDYEAPGEGAKGCDGILRYQAPDKVRLRGDADFVGQILDLASDGERFWYWFDLKGRAPREVVRGTVAGLRQGEGSDLDVLLTMLSLNLGEVLGLVNPSAETGRTLVAVKTYPDTYVIDLVAVEGDVPRPRRQWVVDRRDLTCRHIEAYGQDGHVLVVVDLSGHTVPGVGLAPLPREVRLRLVSSGTTLRFQLREVKVNEPLKESLFRLEVSPGANVTTLP